ncbi:MAG: YitT family protein [Spirochaetales bacterium]
MARKNPFIDFVLLNAGLFLVALGIYLFKIPNHFVTGGVSGLSILAAQLFPGFEVGPVMTGLNLLLVGLGFAFLGFGFGWKTIYASFALSGMVWLLDALWHIPAPLTNDALLELIFAISLPAVGSGLVFNLGASTGGTDIVAKILNTKTHINTGQALLISDFVIAASSLLVFGAKTGMYSVLGLVLKAFIIDLVIESLNVHKKLEIISATPQPILDYILKDLGRGATIYPAVGAYSGTEWKVIHSVVGRRQAFGIRAKVKEIDPKAFITITTTSEIIGKGFRGA